MVSWRPALREMSQDIQRSWVDAAARAQEGIQNSGFLTRVLEVECGSVVGAGLRLACRPDYEALGWTREDAAKWAGTSKTGSARMAKTRSSAMPPAR
jgi:hypothetical protein